jgi:nucleoid-associated protein YgaU
MEMTSAAEQKLSARIRPGVAEMRSRTPYPKRRLSVVPPIGAAALAVEPAAAARAEAAACAEAAEPRLAGAPRAIGPRPAAARPAVQDGPLRLTKRGRIVVGVLVVITFVVATGLIWLLVASQAQAADHVQSGQVTTQALRKVVVRPGETLWGIAVAVDPTADPRAVIQEIIEQNALAGTTIQAGQVLWVPRG